MNANRLRWQEIVAGVGGLALFASLFLQWVDVDCAGSVGECEGLNGWQALSVIDLILSAAAVGAIALPIVAATNSKPDAPITGDAFVALLGIISTILVVFRIADPLGGGDRGVGLFMALGAAVVISASAWSAMADEGTGP